MAYLLDTNIFLRLAGKGDHLRPIVLDALRKLRSQNEVLCYTPQILSEFWNVCTRPASARGGVGLSLIETERKVRIIERYFLLLADSMATFQEWRQLIVTYSVMGVEVYDAKLVASMNVYGVAHLLTFNIGDFKRYPGITVMDPTKM